VGAREIGEVVEAGHRPVFAHHLANDPARVEPGEPGNIDRSFGVAGADENPAGPRDERENMAWGNDGVGPVRSVDRLEVYERVRES
jgi:hypothetical protein